MDSSGVVSDCCYRVYLFVFWCCGSRISFSATCFCVISVSNKNGIKFNILPKKKKYDSFVNQNQNLINTKRVKKRRDVSRKETDHQYLVLLNLPHHLRYTLSKSFFILLNNQYSFRFPLSPSMILLSCLKHLFQSP